MNYSVLMSVYYKEKASNLQESIDSMLNQTVKPEQIVIVKDGKLTLELEKVLEYYKNTYPYLFEYVELEENRGLGEALNIGIKKCRNELIARMDTDDIAKSNRCERQLAEFVKNEKMGVLGCAVDEFTDNPDKIISRRVVPVKPEEIIEFAKRRNPINHPTVMFKKSEVEKCQGYLPFNYYEDYYLWVRMIAMGVEIRNIDDSLVLMRITDDLYNRRGGFKYFKDGVRLRWKIYDMGISNIVDFILSSLVHGLVCIMPNKLRKQVYLRCVRN